MLADREKLVNLGWLLFWGILSTTWCVAAGHDMGATFDEQFYIYGGLKNWHDWNHRELLTQGTMPLPAEVQTLPLRLAEVFASADPGRDWVAWLPTARLGTLVFWWLLLWGSLRLAAEYGGAIAGRLAVALVASEPILLGHASLATTDVPFTACLIALLAVFRSRRSEVSWHRRLAVPAVFFTLTFMTKASAILFTPMCLVMVESERLWRAGWRPGLSGASWRPALGSVRDLTTIAALGTVLLFVVCPRCLRGLLFQIRYQTTGWDSEIFLLGEYSAHGFPHYFAAALAIKLALPGLLMLGVLLMLRPHDVLNGATMAAFGLLALTPVFRIQTGVRYVLPIAALMLVGVAAGYARWWQEQTAPPRRALAGCLAMALVAWSLVSSCLVWPDGMCYTNELFGGTRQQYRSLTESNGDWGQGLNQLARWHDRHGKDAPLFLWYFGTDPRCMDPPFQPLCPNTLEDGADLEKLCRGGYLAVGMTYYTGCYHGTPAVQYLRTLQPCDQTATFLIFDFR